MSQMTVSQMSLQHTTPSPQQRQHWLSEQALAWSGLPVVTIRPTVFLDGFFLALVSPAVRDRGRIELPFGRGKTSPVAAADVARVVAAVLADPGPHLVHSQVHFVAYDFCRRSQIQGLFWVSAGTEEIILTKH
jgi:uncharacterized protein YbjT (DUF2867 family)